jgi:hypothetical protein
VIRPADLVAVSYPLAKLVAKVPALIRMIAFGKTGTWARCQLMQLANAGDAISSTKKACLFCQATSPGVCSVDNYTGEVDSHISRRYDSHSDLVPLENRILCGELRLLGVQAARAYSLIRPFRTGFRRIWRAWKCPAVMQGGWCSASGTRWPIPWCGRAVLQCS